MFEDDAFYKADLRLLERAARHNWPVDENMRKALVNKVARIALTTEDPDYTIKGVRTVGYLDSLNIQRERLALPTALHQHLHLEGMGEERTVELERMCEIMPEEDRRALSRMTGKWKPAVE